MIGCDNWSCEREWFHYKCENGFVVKNVKRMLEVVNRQEILSKIF